MNELTSTAWSAGRPHCPYEGLKHRAAGYVGQLGGDGPHCPYEGLKPGMPRGIIGDGVFGPHCPYEGLKQRLLVPRP